MINLTPQEVAASLQWFDTDDAKGSYDTAHGMRLAAAVRELSWAWEVPDPWHRDPVRWANVRGIVARLKEMTLPDPPGDSIVVPACQQTTGPGHQYRTRCIYCGEELDTP